jgi:glycogen debranching enzyme
VPADDPGFLARCYWQGPVWININWLLADGLERYGRLDAARELRANVLNLIVGSGQMFEYYSPLDGTGAGSNSFSWTAALLVDLLARDDIDEIRALAATRASGRPGVPDARQAADAAAVQEAAVQES